MHVHLERIHVDVCSKYLNVYERIFMIVYKVMNIEEGEKEVIVHGRTLRTSMDVLLHDTVHARILETYMKV
jgi:hypothetical protein